MSDLFDEEELEVDQAERSRGWREFYKGVGLEVCHEKKPEEPGDGKFKEFNQIIEEALKKFEKLGGEDE